MQRYIQHKDITVLIESDWNLKAVIGAGVAVQDAVLIESDWNLK